MNRSITEGRKRFLNVFGEIESGEACEAYSEVLSALATGSATSAQVVSIRPHLRHCAACRATVREMRFSRAKRLALFGPFAWLARLLSRPEVYAVSTGGGRFGPAAAAIGLCLSGVGAATCVMTGAIPAAAPLIAVGRREARAEASGEEGQAQGDQARRADAHAGGDRRASRRADADAAEARGTARNAAPREAREEEGAPARASSGSRRRRRRARRTPAPVKATVSSVGGGGGNTGGSAPAAKSGGEFGFEGG